MNYFLPVHCGAPDYKNNFYFSSIINSKEKSFISNKNSLPTSVRDSIYGFETIGSYLAGL